MKQAQAGCLRPPEPRSRPYGPANSRTPPYKNPRPFQTVTGVVSSMFLMCHLLTGILIGMPLSGYFRDRHIVTACAVGALLPDLIDKPLGHFLLDGGIGSGRIY